MASVDEIIDLILALPEDERGRVYEGIRRSLPRHPMEVRLRADSRTLLEAISRANDFTIRGIEGIIAEAVFAIDLLPRLDGWEESWKPADAPYDFPLHKEGRATDVRLQVKMQRRRNHVPLMASEVLKLSRKWPVTSFVVEVQRTRGGTRGSGTTTRPYRFGEFDVLAVSLGAATGYWGDFVFTVARWLLPDPNDRDAILKYQPVEPNESEDWTRDFNRVIQWLDSGAAKTIKG